MADPTSAAAGRGTGRYAGRTVLVCGIRLAGVAAARALLAEGARVLLTDRDRTVDVDPLERAGAGWLGELATVPADVELVVTSPGWPPTHPLLQDGLHSGREVIGETELAWRLRRPGVGGEPAPWLAVTGTNGKTTTVRMLESILRAAGLRTLAVGNVGVSIIDAVTDDEPYDVLAVELSSFQLHWSSTMRPAAGALLNLAEDHLDWHGSMGTYALTKTKIWDAPVAVGNLDDPYVARLLTGVDSRAQDRRVGFTLGEPQPGQLGVVGGSLVDRAFDASAGTAGATLLPVGDVRPAGPHNVANALAAAALARAHGVAPEEVATGLRDFVPDPHRNQLVGLRDGVRWVDDSKATNPHAALASLSSYDSIVWVAGGQLKDVDPEPLVRAAGPRLKAAVLLGVDRAAIADALRRHAPQIPVVDVASTDDGAMTEVVHAAAGLAAPGDTVLLAPAAASYDMFTGYAARGRAFAAAVEQLPESGNGR